MSNTPKITSIKKNQIKYTQEFESWFNNINYGVENHKNLLSSFKNDMWLLNGFIDDNNTSTKQYSDYKMAQGYIIESIGLAETNEEMTFFYKSYVQNRKEVFSQFKVPKEQIIALPVQVKIEEIVSTTVLQVKEIMLEKHIPEAPEKTNEATVIISPSNLDVQNVAELSSGNGGLLLSTSITVSLGLGILAYYGSKKIRKKPQKNFSNKVKEDILDLDFTDNYGVNFDKPTLREVPNIITDKGNFDNEMIPVNEYKIAEESTIDTQKKQKIEDIGDMTKGRENQEKKNSTGLGNENFDTEKSTEDILEHIRKYSEKKKNIKNHEKIDIGGNTKNKIFIGEKIIIFNLKDRKKKVFSTRIEGKYFGETEEYFIIGVGDEDDIEIKEKDTYDILRKSEDVESFRKRKTENY